MRRVWLLLLPLLLAAPAVGEEGKVAVDSVLKGRFLSLDDDRVAIKYDFSDPKQVDDWYVTKPFKVAGSLTAEFENKAVRLKGVGSWCMKATFADDVSLDLDIKPWMDRDFGVSISEEIESDQFLLFSVNDLYFQKFDGARVPGHMITRFGIKDDSDKKGDIAFRYIARGKKPDIHKFDVLHLSAGKEGVDDTFKIGDKSFSGVEMGRKLLDMHIGIYMIEGQAIVDNVTVRGRLSPRWIKKNNVELRLSKPIETVDPEVKAEAEAKKKLEKFQAGEMTARDLLTEVVADPDVTDDTRDAAAKALEEAGDKTIARHLVPLLYSPDLKSRELAHELVRKLVGRTFGYSPKADEEKRSAAIKKLVTYINKNADEFGSSR